MWSDQCGMLSESPFEYSSWGNDICIIGNLDTNDTQCSSAIPYPTPPQSEYDSNSVNDGVYGFPGMTQVSGPMVSALPVSSERQS